jgi:alpha-L-fucosidase 2
MMLSTILLCLLASLTFAALKQPAATLIFNAINTTSFLSRADMVWDWELHANASEVDAQYVRHDSTCVQRASDPFYRRLAGSVRCRGNLSGCVAEAAALCDANECCAAVQRNASSPDDELLLYGSAFPLSACAGVTSWIRSPFDRAPTTFNQGGWVGGGLLGWQVRTARRGAGAPFGSALRIDIGRRDVWDVRAPGSPHATGGALLDRPRLPIGFFSLTPAGAVLRGAMRLSVAGAELTVHLDTDAGALDLRLLAPAGAPPPGAAAPVLLLRATATPGEAAALDTLAFTPLQAASQVLPWPAGYTPNAPAQCAGAPAAGACVQSLLGGGDFATAWRVAPGGGGAPAPGLTSITLFASVANLAGERNASGSGAVAVAAVDAALAAGESAIRAAHAEWWADFWDASAVALPDARLEGFYALQMLKLGMALGGGAAAGAPASPQPLDLMGPWYTHSRWALYWVDMNLQLTYWPLLASNHAALSATLPAWLTARRIALAATAGTFAADSLAIEGAVSADLVGDPAAAAPPGAVGCLPWLAHSAWLHARMTGNETEMREDVYPLLRGAVNHYLHMLVDVADGDVVNALHLPVTSSPEYPLKGPDASFDLALFRWGAAELLALAAELRIDEPLAANYSDVGARLAPLPVDAHGIMVASNVSFTIPHRHWSHLFAIWPLRTLDWRTADAPGRALIEASVDHYAGLTCAQRRADGGVVWECPNGFTGDGVAALSVHMNRPNAAVGNLTAVLDSLIPPNTLYGEENESPNIESAVAQAHVLHELLLQTDPGAGATVRVFPALPANWSAAAFWRLSAAGALVSAVRAGNDTQWAHAQGAATAGARGRAGGITLVVEGLPAGPLYVTTVPPNLNWTQVAPNAIYLPSLAPDEEVLVRPAGGAAHGAAAPPAVAPVPNDAAQYNGWGWHSPPTGPRCSVPPFIDVRAVLPDLYTPPMSSSAPGPGRRVAATTPGWPANAYHAVYLPPAWSNASTAPLLPLIVELAGNGPWASPYGDVSLGRPEGSNLGFGITAGVGAVWVSVPMLTAGGDFVETWWWGCPAVPPFTGAPPVTPGESAGHCVSAFNITPSIRFLADTVRHATRAYRADPARVVIAGFSRGAVGVNYLGLADDDVASLWAASIAYAHYDGQPMDAKNPYPNAGPPASYDRLRRLGRRPQYIVAELNGSIVETAPYINASGVSVNAIFAETGFCNHNDGWTLRPSAARDALRAWFWAVVGGAAAAVK